MGVVQGEFCSAALTSSRSLSYACYPLLQLAVITQGIAARVAQKQASSAEAKVYATKFPHAADAAMHIAQGKQGGKL
jgi:hypothetical protein